MSRELTHMMLVANAGSGKTYSLTTRMVGLLARGVEPRKIAALTFTKKAAGEFLDAVFVRIAAAAEDSEKLDRLREDTGLPDLDAAQCRTILRKVVSQMGALCMGTIDSLFARIARAFPFESGLSGDFAILGDAAVLSAREDALAALFRNCVQDRAGFQEFLDIVRQQSRKQGERDVFKALLEAVVQFHEKFLATPAGVTWGDRKAIWPDGCRILSAGDPRTAADAFWHAVDSTHPDLAEEARTLLKNNLETVAALRSGDSWPKEVSDFVKSKLCSQPKNGHLQILRKKEGWVKLTPDVEAARAALLQALLRLEFESLLRRSAALYGLMARFEEIYARQTRGQGQLTFDDIKDLLARQVDDPGWRAAAGYRLDSRFDHWLLDEFQDTSRSQWKVLASFIDEIVQDAGANRSLFYVGDTKQAIYLWRGGDPKLFFEILNHYNQFGEKRIVSETLGKSFRSTREIVDAVNEVFGNMSVVEDDLSLPAQSVLDWKQAWREHEVAPQNEGKPGYVRWVPVEESAAPADGEDEGAEAGPQDLEILRILQEVRPWSRQWSCAVLKRSNKEVAELAALLQSAGIPVAVEGKSNPCTDNSLGAALVAALRFVASPADTLAGALMAGSLLAEALLEDGEFQFRESALHSIALDGYAKTLRAWIGALALPPFLAGRAAAFLSAASEFDAGRQAGDGIFQFLDFIESYQIQEAESADVVRVMTVHQAKGLTFDMAVVSGLDALNKDRSAGTLALGGTGNQPEWGILLPAKVLAEQDETLARARETVLAESTYGELCAAYVAMTRPRFGLYVVTPKLKEGTSAKNFSRMLGMTLGQTEPYYERGDVKWYELRAVGDSLPVDPAKDISDVQLPPPTPDAPRPVSPSSLKGMLDASEKTEPSARISFEAGVLGTEVHEALAGIEWVAEKMTSFVGCSKDARKLLDEFMDGPRARKIFTKPDRPCLLWREKAFDVIVDGRWVSGVFDRIQILLDPAGMPTAAVVYDFKTDNAAPDAISSRYADQMAAYRTAAAALLGLSEDNVSVETVPVRVFPASDPQKYEGVQKTAH